MRSQARFALGVAVLLAAGSSVPTAQSAATVPISPHSVTLNAVTADGRGAWSEAQFQRAVAAAVAPTRSHAPAGPPDTPASPVASRAEASACAAAP